MTADPRPLVGAAHGPGTRDVAAAGKVVERYLDRMVAHDWDAMADCLAEDVVRVGPFGDTYSGKASYVAFLSGLLPSLAGYSMRLDRVVSQGRFAVAELTETVEIDGSPLETPEALVFDLDAQGRIAHISIYIQRLGAPA
ncbi:MAG TPA: nuclear transport factor 2 family protein [Acidimicrobiales bacterium]|nr:nuclear transport factor 2 family protein [Acidimicrobiales bacterium]